MAGLAGATRAAAQEKACPEPWQGKSKSLDTGQCQEDSLALGWDGRWEVGGGQ